ncbi:MAG: sigma-54 dependent transcriptional regulator [Bacteroidota bacterium]
MEPTARTGSVLVVDDNEDVLTAIRLLLKPHVETIHTATRPDALPTLLREERYDVVLLDMNFTKDASSGKEGLTWLGHVQKLDPEAVVILITAYGDVSLAVEAMKGGATDFVTKPWQNEKLVATVKNGIQLRRTKAEVATLRDRQVHLTRDLDRPYQDIVGESDPMQAVFATIDKVAATDANVLILGENGTGKELVARAIHRRSRRADEIFVAVDLGALTESLFESELFGYTKGAFTGANADRAGRFEVASGGTLFLDEIGNIGAAQQAKLLTVLQRREVTRVGAPTPVAVDVRLVSATNAPLYERVSEGAFRQDLLYRINTVEIVLPPLRERGDDIDLLAEHFLKLYAQKYDKPVRDIAASARNKLRGYRWPGNVRELQHTMERAVILADGTTVKPDVLDFTAPPDLSKDRLALDSLDLEEIERTVIRKALSKHGGNISRAADDLGLTRKSLYRRIEKYGL